MVFTNARGQYGGPPHIGAEVKAAPSGDSSAVPWMLGGVGVAVGLALLGVHTAKRVRPRLSAQEKEIRAWEAEFPGLPWYLDQVKDSQQLDMWERARDYWERTH